MSGCYWCEISSPYFQQQQESLQRILWICSMRLAFTSLISACVMGLQPALAEAVDEKSAKFIDGIVLACLQWVDERDPTFFEDTWKLSKDSRRDRKLAELDPALAGTGNPNFFFSPQYRFTGGYKDTGKIVSCSVGDNIMSVDEEFKEIQDLADFDFKKGVEQLTQWGLEHAENRGFIDWPEAAEDFFGTNLPDHVVFVKKRCRESGLTKLTGTAYLTRQSEGILPLYSWSLKMDHYDRDAFMDDKKFTAYINSACP